MTDTEMGWLDAKIVESRARKIRSIRDPQFDQLASWNKFRECLLNEFADGGPVTEDVWEAADDFWHEGVRVLIRKFKTKKAEEIFVAEQLSNYAIRYPRD